MKLRDYLRDNAETQTAFANRSKVPQSTVSRICLDLGCHSNSALAVIRATGGLVTLEDLQRPGPTRRTVRRTPQKAA